MKKLYSVLLSAFMLLSIQSNAQNALNGKLAEKTAIPFGKKLSPPDLTKYQDNALWQMFNTGTKTSFMQNISKPQAKSAKERLAYLKQLSFQKKIMQPSYPAGNGIATAKEDNINSNINFHLIKDINALAESYPNNYVDFFDNTLPYQPPGNTYYPTAPFAVLNDVAYFAADDGIHGNELWRSDGTAAGTYLVKDIEPGFATSSLYAITSSNGKIYFAAYTAADGYAAWVSDGTESGTQVLTPAFNVTAFFSMGNKTYFVSDGSDFWSALWKTDGTAAGTKQVIDFSNEGIGLGITEPIVVNHTIFFTLYNYTTGYELWETDGTDAGTHHLATNTSFADVPLQLTKYDNKLYFSADDGTGRKLWVSDGTDAGTMPAPGNNNIMVDVNYSTSLVLFYTIQQLPILNHVLYFAGTSASKGDGLYKYDASNSDGVVLVKDLVPDGDTASIESVEMQTANNKLYFKVTNNTGGVHDELWSSEGTKASTQVVYKLLPEETIHNLYSSDGTLYFVKYDKLFGTELWKVFDTPFGSLPFIESDIFKGSTSSFPTNLTAFKNRLIFSAVNGEKGDELFATNTIGIGASLVKDINTVSTSNSNAGLNSRNSYYGINYNGMAALGKDVLFNAYERVHGNELYKSDGTAKGTELLNEIVPGEAGFNIYDIVSKNNAVYFTTASSTDGANYFIYKTNGTKSGLTKIVSDNFLIQSFDAADNGLVFYTHYNSTTFLYELWRTDGTAAGTFLLSSNAYSNNYLNIIGNTALFVAGDNDHGYELWKSDGTVAGTKLIKDIYPGSEGSYPSGLFLYNDEVYFGAYDGVNHAFWKSDGTKSGTIQLRNIDPWWGSDVETTKRYFCVSNNILYFSAINYSNGKGTELWKTDGTSAGTQVIKDINPDTSARPGPYYLTDVNGTVFFVGNDTLYLNRVALWKTDGTAKGTQYVKDVAPYSYVGTSMNGLTSFGGKLYFQNQANFKYYLWVSDGTENGTHVVNDPGIMNVEIRAIFANGDKLFLSGDTTQYGIELYVGKVNNDGKLIVSKVSENNLKITSPLNVVLYPNPAKDVLNINIGSVNTSKATLQVTNIAGNILINKELEAFNKQNVLQLNVSHLAAGSYFIKIISADGSEKAVKKFIKQ